MTLGSGDMEKVGTLSQGDMLALSPLPPYHLSATGVARNGAKFIQFSWHWEITIALGKTN